MNPIDVPFLIFISRDFGRMVLQKGNDMKTKLIQLKDEIMSKGVIKHDKKTWERYGLKPHELDQLMKKLQKMMPKTHFIYYQNDPYRPMCPKAHDWTPSMWLLKIRRNNHGNG